MCLLDDPKPETSSSSTSGAASSSNANLAMLKEICPDLAEEIIQDQEKKEPCKKCHDKVG